MSEFEFRIVSDHRVGLLLEVGRVISSCGFTLLRPRVATTPDGVMLSVVVRGPEAGLLVLEDKLASHPLVRSFEAGAAEHDRTVAPPAVSPPVTPVAAAPAVAAAHAAGAAPTRPEVVVPVDPRKIEALLATVARDYPAVLEPVATFARILPRAQREAVLTQIGTRVGAWIYKRDYALGARLNLHDSLRQIALPAIRQLLRETELHDHELSVRNSPFCAMALRAPSCQFISGYVEGLLNESDHLGRIHVVETACRSAGAERCHFMVSGA